MLCRQCIAYFAIRPDQDPRAFPDWRGAFGHSGLGAYMEVQKLMLESLATAGIKKIHIDLGHVAVFRGLVRGAGIPPELEAELYRALQSKDIDALENIGAGLNRQVDRRARQALLLLPELYGGFDVLEVARRSLPDYADIRNALDELETLGKQLIRRWIRWHLTWLTSAGINTTAGWCLQRMPAIALTPWL